MKQTWLHEFQRLFEYDAVCKVIKVDSSIYLELEREATTILFCEPRPNKSAWDPGKRILPC